jgi:hypothetical protein
MVWAGGAEGLGNAGFDAGPSTPLRSAQDDTFSVRLGREELQQQKQPQVPSTSSGQALRLRCASLRMTNKKKSGAEN